MVAPSSRFSGRPPRLGCRTAAVLVFAFLVPLIAVGRWAGAVSPAASRGDPAVTVRVFTRSPVLVRPGERVEIPIDAVCSTPAGRACPSTVTLRIRGGAGLVWHTV